MSPPRLSVRPITPAEHAAYLARQRSASFLQTPGWAAVKGEWRAESLGWFAGDGSGGDPCGVALVLHRSLPRVRRSLAYLPEGPVIDWADPDLASWLAPLTRHLAEQGAFAVRIGPAVVTRRWSAAQVKAGVAEETVASLTELAPLERPQIGAAVVSQLRGLGWRALGGTAGGGAGFAAGQPQFNVQIPLVDVAGSARSEADVLAGMNQLWRRNIKKAAKAGVVVSCSATGESGAGDGQIAAEDLAAFHALYVETAARDGFTPRGQAYFTTMVRALSAEEQRPGDRIRLYLARHEGDLVAATIWIHVGAHAWYSYGASSTDKREVRGSNAVQWQMIRDALAAGAEVYDLRGITDTLDAEDPHVGLITFKVGAGGEAVEYAGEWDLPLNRLLYRAFDLYMRRRG